MFTLTFGGIAGPCTCISMEWTLTLVSQWLGHARLDTTLIYAHADTEQKRKAIEQAASPDSPLKERLNAARFTVDDEDVLKRLYGLR